VRRFGKNSRAERFAAIEVKTLDARLGVSPIMKESKKPPDAPNE
jgi:hypothetical protein